MAPLDFTDAWHQYKSLYPQQHFTFNFFLYDSKNKFVLWGRDDEFDRFLEQKVKEMLGILAGGILVNSIRLYIWGYELKRTFLQGDGEPGL